MNRFPFPDKLLPRILVRILPVTIISLFAIWLIASTLIRSTLETEIEKKLNQEALHSSLALAARLESVVHMAKVLAKNDLATAKPLIEGLAQSHPTDFDVLNLRADVALRGATYLAAPLALASGAVRLWRSDRLKTGEGVHGGLRQGSWSEP